MPERLLIRVHGGAASGALVEWDPESGPLGCGRDPTLGLCVPDDHVSARHAELVQADARVYVRDLGSRNGTRILHGGRLLSLRPQQLHALAEGELISIGDAERAVLLELVPASAAEQDAAQADVVAIASTHIGRLADLESRLSHEPLLLRTLYEGLRRLSRLLELSDIIEAGVELVFDVLPAATHVTLYLESEHEGEETRYIPIVCQRRGGVTEAPRPLSRFLREQVLDAKTALLASQGHRLEQSRSLQAAAIDSIVAVPLWIGDRVCGLLQADRRATAASSGPAFLTPDDLERAVLVASQLILAIDHARLYQRVRASEENLRHENRFLKNRQEASTNDIIGQSEAMQRVLALVDRVRNVAVPVCIIGETGTGKELVARAIHYRSSLRDKLFVAQNCAALPEDLLESELFGYVKGAFTGADGDKKGLLELADGGSIFLDEIGETSPAFQAKLLRFLQDGEFRPVGSVRTKRVQVRVISATNRNLEEEVAEGRFRQDLYYRLNVFPVKLPPLRDRVGDIRLLAQHFMRKYALDFGRPPLSFTPEALDLMASYKWPGNIRELQNEIQRLIIVNSSGFVSPDELSPRIRSIEDLLGKAGDDSRLDLRARLENVERYLLIEALRDHDNNKTQTAKTLNLTREGLHKKLTRLGIG